MTDLNNYSTNINNILYIMYITYILNLTILISFINSNLLYNFYKYSSLKKINDSNYKKIFIINSLLSDKKLIIKNEINNIILKFINNLEYHELSNEEKYYILAIINLL